MYYWVSTKHSQAWVVLKDYTACETEEQLEGPLGSALQQKPQTEIREQSSLGREMALPWSGGVPGVSQLLNTA